MVGWICIHARCQRTFVRPSQVIEVIEPVDIPSGLHPAGWCDSWAGAIRININGIIQTVGFGPGEWPDVLAALGCADGVTPERIASPEPNDGGFFFAGPTASEDAAAFASALKVHLAQHGIKPRRGEDEDAVAFASVLKGE